MISISTATELALRAAMARLIDGRPNSTDGRLTVVNLAAEAGVSRATANRATTVLETFREAVAEIRHERGNDGGSKPANREENRRHVEDLLAQHEQVRALLRVSEQRRIERDRVHLRIIRP
ncbi:hypothetical protein V5F77_26315 [Xanthobacter sp. DSM 24535]|uniref:hypothetical protein n=1 Tax=Roseixanthobacter psychrophilus TaxID=3119917 RepID=UPI00372AE937